MKNHKLFIGLLAVGLAATATQAVEPVLSYEVTGNELILTYSGTLLQSTDAVNWTEVASASSPYKVTLGDKKLFFCAKDGSESKNITIPLSDTVNLDMIWIEPGTFLMGSPEDELGREDNETQHEVTLTRGYWLGKYEVTQAQYEAVTGKDPSYNKGSDLPVEQVNWDDAKEFCAKLTAIEKAAGRLPEGYEYTLPTEAQWEYACRAGTTTALNSGKNLSDAKQCPEMDEVGWYWYNSKIDDYRRTTYPVGQKLPNVWGLYDMHGNVNEWCLDWYGDYPTSAVTDPLGAVTGWCRVIRSGSWNNNACNCSSAFRSYTAFDNRSNGIGFRVALVYKDMSIPLADDVRLDMIWVKPGTFIMGSPEGELGGYTFEVQHEVTLTRGYWLGKYEVTQEQYEAVMGYNPSYFRGDDRKNHPVEYVTWEEAIEFCAKLTAIERETGRLPQGYVYSLPTSAQWEYACRAGTTTALNSGKNLSDKDKCPEMDEVGWYRYNSGEYDADGKDTDNGRHYPVGQKLPNAWGFYDMHGNVEEWCVDKSGEKYTNTAVTDPVTLVGTSSVVIRGGDYRYSTARDCRSAYRTGIDSIYGGAYIGFRVALVREMVIPLSSYVNLDMIWIEPGTFIMGSPTDELGRDDDETQHQVTLTQGYWMGRHEITQAQYYAVMRTNPSYFTDSKMLEKRMLPIEQVSWNDAMEFCAKLTAIEREAGRLPEGYEYTLPTEAQWEYACRAGTTTALYSGKNLTGVEVCPNVDELGWYANNSNNKTYDVGQKLPNAWGLYDMCGNVWEWCLDKKGDYPTTPVIDPVELVTGMDHARHGGCWQNYAAACRSANRGYRSNSDKDTGFRVVLTPVK